MSEVRVRALRPRAAGGKSGSVKVWRGIWRVVRSEKARRKTRELLLERLGLVMDRLAGPGVVRGLLLPL